MPTDAELQAAIKRRDQYLRQPQAVREMQQRNPQYQFRPEAGAYISAPGLDTTNYPGYQTQPMNTVNARNVGNGQVQSYRWMPGLSQMPNQQRDDIVRSFMRYGAYDLTPGFVPDYAPTYWEDPRRVARYYHLLQSAAPDDPIFNWIDAEGVSAAYKYFQQANNNAPWQEWKYLSPDDPARSWLQQVGTPPAEIMFPFEAFQEQYGQYMMEQDPLYQEAMRQGGGQEVQYENLPAWQKLIAPILQSPAAHGAFTAVPWAILATLSGGPVSGLGTLAGGAALGVAAQHSETIAELLNVMDIPAGILEGGVGAVAQYLGAVMDPEAYGTVEEFNKNVVQAYKAGQTAYETVSTEGAITRTSSNIFQGIENALYDLGMREAFGERLIRQDLAGPGEAWHIGLPEPVDISSVFDDQQLGLAAIVQARRDLVDGRSFNDIQEEVNLRYGFTGQMAELFARSAADPLNVIEPYGGKILWGPLADALGNPALGRAMRETHGLAQGLELYKVMLRTGQTGLTVADLSHAGAFTRFMAGVTKDGQVRSGGPVLGELGRKFIGTIPFVGDWINLMFEMTPASRLKTILGIVSDNAQVLLYTDRDNPEAMVQRLKTWGNTPLEAAAEYSQASLGSPEGYLASSAIRDFVSRVADEHLDIWHMTETNRRILMTLAEVLGDTPDEILAAISSGIDDTDAIFNRFMDRVQQSGHAHAEDIIAAASRGEFTPQALADMHKVFTETGAPYHPHEFAAQLMASLLDHTAEWGIKEFGIKKEPGIYRLANTIKAAQSLVLLGMNPTYFVNNFINGEVTMALAGTWGMWSPERLQGFWDKFGIQPYRYEAGLGAADIGSDLGTAAEMKIRAAQQEDAGALGEIGRKIRQTNDKVGVFMKFSREVEKWQSRRAFTTSTQRMWRQLWRRGVGFDAMPPHLENTLRNIDPDLPGMVYGIIEGGMNQRDMEARLFGTLSRNVDSFLPEVAQEVGIPADRLGDLLGTAGVMDFLSERWNDDLTPDEKIRVFDELEARVQDHLDELAATEAKARAAEAAQRVASVIPGDTDSPRMGDALDQIVGLFDEVSMRELVWWNDHFIKWAETYEMGDRASSKGARNAIFAARSANANRDAQRLRAYQLATYEGILTGLREGGLEPPASFISNIEKMHREWDTFFKKSDAAKREHFNTEYETHEEGLAAWTSLEATLNDMYRDYSESAFKLQEAVDKAAVSWVKKQGGKAAADNLMMHRENIMQFRRDMRNRMVSFRSSLVGKPGSERRKAWYEFINNEYLPMIAEFEHMNMEAVRQVVPEVRQNIEGKPGGEEPPAEGAAPVPEEPTGPQEGPSDKGASVPIETAEVEVSKSRVQELVDSGMSLKDAQRQATSEARQAGAPEVRKVPPPPELVKLRDTLLKQYGMDKLSGFLGKMGEINKFIEAGEGKPLTVDDFNYPTMDRLNEMRPYLEAYKQSVAEREAYASRVDSDGKKARDAAVHENEVQERIAKELADRTTIAGVPQKLLFDERFAEFWNRAERAEFNHFAHVLNWLQKEFNTKDINNLSAEQIADAVRRLDLRIVDKETSKAAAIEARAAELAAAEQARKAAIDAEKLDIEAYRESRNNPGPEREAIEQAIDKHDNELKESGEYFTGDEWVDTIPGLDREALKQARYKSRQEFDRAARYKAGIDQEPKEFNGKIGMIRQLSVDYSKATPEQIVVLNDVIRQRAQERTDVVASRPENIGEITRLAVEKVLPDNVKVKNVTADYRTFLKEDIVLNYPDGNWEKLSVANAIKEGLISAAEAGQLFNERVESKKPADKKPAADTAAVPTIDDIREAAAKAAMKAAEEEPYVPVENKLASEMPETGVQELVDKLGLRPITDDLFEGDLNSRFAHFKEGLTLNDVSRIISLFYGDKTPPNGLIQNVWDNIQKGNSIRQTQKFATGDTLIDLNFKGTGDIAADVATVYHSYLPYHLDPTVNVVETIRKIIRSNPGGSYDNFYPALPKDVQSAYEALRMSYRKQNARLQMYFDLTKQVMEITMVDGVSLANPYNTVHQVLAATITSPPDSDMARTIHRTHPEMTLGEAQVIAEKIRLIIDIRTRSGQGLGIVQTDRDARITYMADLHKDMVLKTPSDFTVEKADEIFRSLPYYTGEGGHAENAFREFMSRAAQKGISSFTELVADADIKDVFNTMWLITANSPDMKTTTNGKIYEYVYDDAVRNLQQTPTYSIDPAKDAAKQKQKEFYRYIGDLDRRTKLGSSDYFDGTDQNTVLEAMNKLKTYADVAGINPDDKAMYDDVMRFLMHYQDYHKRDLKGLGGVTSALPVIPSTSYPGKDIWGQSFGEVTSGGERLFVTGRMVIGGGVDRTYMIDNLDKKMFKVAALNRLKREVDNSPRVKMSLDAYDSVYHHDLELADTIKISSQDNIAVELSVSGTGRKVLLDRNYYNLVRHLFPEAVPVISTYISSDTKSTRTMLNFYVGTQRVAMIMGRAPEAGVSYDITIPSNILASRISPPTVVSIRKGQYAGTGTAVITEVLPDNKYKAIIKDKNVVLNGSDIGVIENTVSVGEPITTAEFQSWNGWLESWKHEWRGKRVSFRYMGETYVGVIEDTHTGGRMNPSRFYTIALDNGTKMTVLQEVLRPAPVEDSTPQDLMASLREAAGYDAELVNETEATPVESTTVPTRTQEPDTRETWRMTRKEYVDRELLTGRDVRDAETKHYMEVRKAVFADKEVPFEVMMEYPFLTSQWAYRYVHDLVNVDGAKKELYRDLYRLMEEGFDDLGQLGPIKEDDPRVQKVYYLFDAINAVFRDNEGKGWLEPQRYNVQQAMDNNLDLTRKPFYWTSEAESQAQKKGSLSHIPDAELYWLYDGAPRGTDESNRLHAEMLGRIERKIAERKAADDPIAAAADDAANNAKRILKSQIAHLVDQEGVRNIVGIIEAITRWEEYSDAFGGGYNDAQLYDMIGKESVSDLVYDTFQELMRERGYEGELLAVPPIETDTPGGEAIGPEGIFSPDGIGSIPLQIGNAYGMNRKMKPSEYLSYVPEVSHSTSEGIESAMREGKVFANPVLFVAWDGKNKVWNNTQHEGRNRMLAFQNIYGDIPVDVRLVFDNGLRANNVTMEMGSAPIMPDARKEAPVERPPDLGDFPDREAAKIRVLTKRIAAKWEAQESLDRTEFETLATSLGFDMENDTDVSRMYDALEGGVSMAYRKWRENNPSATFEERMAVAQRYEDSLITARRTLQKTSLQQFSTPFPISLASAYAADVRPGDVIMEPEAGTANLVDPLYGTENVVIKVNELDEGRRAVLESMGYQPTKYDVLKAEFNFTEDGKIIPAEATVIVHNPPWGSYKSGKYGDPVNITYRDADGIQKTLKPNDWSQRFYYLTNHRVVDGGRVVSVFPTNLVYTRNRSTGEISPAGSSFRTWLNDNFHVRAIIESPEGAYDARGTTVGSILLVVDKTKAPDDALPAIEAWGDNAPKDWAEYISLVKSLSEDGSHARYSEVKDVRERRNEGVETVEAAALPTGNTEIEREASAVERFVPSTERREPYAVSGTSAAGGSPGDGGSTSRRETIPDSNVVSRKPRRKRTDPPPSDRLVPDAIVVRNNELVRDYWDSQSDAIEDSGSYTFSTYTPRESISRHPRPYVEGKALAGVRVPELTYNVSDIVQAARQRGMISDDQHVGAAYALQANAEGHAFVAADGTGTGKGRMMAYTAWDMIESAGKKRILVLSKNDATVAAQIEYFHVVGGGKYDEAGRTVIDGEFPYRIVMIHDRPLDPLPVFDEPTIYIGSYIDMKKYATQINDLRPDGLLADEAHVCKNLDGSDYGKTWAALHAAMEKDAYQVYYTATPAENINELHYLLGLGLWGPSDKSFQLYTDLITGTITKEEYDGIKAAAKVNKQVSEFREAAISKYADLGGMLDETPITIQRPGTPAYQKQTMNVNVVGDDLGGKYKIVLGEMGKGEFFIGVIKKDELNTNIVGMYPQASVVGYYRGAFFERNRRAMVGLLREIVAENPSISFNALRDQIQTQYDRLGFDEAKSTGAVSQEDIDLAIEQNASGLQKKIKGWKETGVSLSPAMTEQVMRELKANGMFMTRELWRGGTEYRVEQASAVDEFFFNKYDEIAELYHDIETAFYEFAAQSNDPGLSFGVRSMLGFDIRQRTGAERMKDAIRIADQSISEGRRVVLSVEYISAITEEGGNLRAAIDAIPVQERNLDEEGAVIGMGDMMPEALEARALLHERASALEHQVISNIEAVINHYGRENVAIISGLPKELKNIKADMQREIERWQNGEATVAILSKKGDTGISLHDKGNKYGESWPVELIFVDYDWTATTVIQRLGRVDRADQLSSPLVTLLKSSSPIDNKFVATAATRLRDTGATSRGGADTAAGDEWASFDMMSTFHLDVFKETWRTLPNEIKAYYTRWVGSSGDIPAELPSKVNNMRAVLNEVMFMPPHVQVETMKHFDEVMEQMTDSAAYELMQQQYSKVVKGKVLRETSLARDDGKDLNMYEVRDTSGKQYALISGIFLDDLRNIRNMLSENTKDLQSVSFVSFQDQDVGDTISGIQIPSGKISRIAKFFFVDMKANITRDTALAAIHAGDSIPVNGPGNRVYKLRMRNDGKIAIDRALMSDKNSLLGAGAKYIPKGNLWFIPEESLQRFFDSYPLLKSIAATMATGETPTDGIGNTSPGEEDNAEGYSTEMRSPDNYLRIDPGKADTYFTREDGYSREDGIVPMDPFVHGGENGMTVSAAVYKDGILTAYIPAGEKYEWFDTATGPVRVLGLDVHNSRMWVLERGDGTTFTRPVIQGGSEAAEVPPPAASMNDAVPYEYRGQDEEEAWSAHIMPALASLREKMTRTDPPKKFNLGETDPDTTRQLQDYMRRSVYGRMSDNKLAAIRWGQNRRDAALLNYTKRYNIDSLANIIYPYEFFYTRSFLRHLSRIFDKPGYYAFYARLRNMQRNTLYSPGFPTRLRDKVKIPMPFLPDWAGGGLWVDPFRQLFPFEQLATPLETMARENSMVDQRTATILQSWLQEGKYSDAEIRDAINSRSGHVWEQAKTMAEQNVDRETSNPFDFMNLIVSPSLPINILYNVLKGTPNEINNLPPTRAIQAITSLAGWASGNPTAGVNVEAPIRRALGMDEFPRWHQYRIERQLANMAVEGYDTNEVQRAMIEQAGPLYEEAKRRAGLEAATGTATSWAGMTSNMYGEGEEQFRGMQQQLNAAFQWANETGDRSRVNEFFDEHPEYESRLALFDEPEERLRGYMVDLVWDTYNGFDRAQKAQIREGLGDIFQMTFLDKETRSYDAVDIATMAMWVRFMRQAEQVPNVPEAQQAPSEMVQMMTPAAMQGGIDYLDPGIAAGVTDYRDTKDALFPHWYALLDRYYSTEPSQRDAFKNAWPELEAMWAWENDFLRNRPDLIPYVKPEGWEPKDYPVSAEARNYLRYQEFRSYLDAPLAGQLTRYYYADYQLGEGAIKDLRRIYDQMGITDMSFGAFMNTIVSGAMK